jgi:hypothetical protein
MSDQIPDTKSTKQRTRSPGYPTTDLQDALEKAKIVWDKDGRHEVPIESLAIHWGYNSKSSSAAQLAAALRKFGLFSDSVDKNGHVKLSDAAIHILNDADPSSPTRLELLKKAALSPKVYASMWAKYQGSLPSDATIKTYLIVDLKFNQDVVDRVIRDFRATINFAKLSSNDKVTAVAQNDDDGNTTEAQQSTSKEMLDSTVQDRVNLPPVTVPQGVATVLREFNFPLPAGVATLKVPFPLTEDDFESLMKTLKSFKEGLVKTEIPSLDCKDIGHEAQAEALAAAGIAFNLINFSYSHDIAFAMKIAQAHDLKLRLNLNWGMALLKKKDQE